MLRVVHTGKPRFSSLETAYANGKLSASFQLPQFFSKGTWTVGVSSPASPPGGAFRGGELQFIPCTVSCSASKHTSDYSALEPGVFRFELSMKPGKVHDIVLKSAFADGTSMAFSLGAMAQAEVGDIENALDAIDFKGMYDKIESETGSIAAKLEGRTDAFEKDQKASYDSFSKKLNEKRAQMFSQEFTRSGARELYGRMLNISPLFFHLSSISLKDKEAFYSTVIKVVEASVYSAHDESQDYIKLATPASLGDFSLSSQKMGNKTPLSKTQDFSLDFNDIMKKAEERNEILIYQAGTESDPGIGTVHFSFVKNKPVPERKWTFELKDHELKVLEQATLIIATGFIKGFMVDVSVNGNNPLKLYGFPLFPGHKRNQVNELFQRIPLQYLKSGENEICIRPARIYSDLMERKVFVHSLILSFDKKHP